MYKIKHITIIVLALLLLSKCNRSDNSKKGGDKIVAEVYNKSLLKSEINYSISGEVDKQDSTTLEQSYIQHWIRKTLLAKNANKQVKDIDEIDKLVKEYKNSLTIEFFEKQYIKENLDTVVLEKDLEDFYKENKNNFLLDHSIINLLYAKIDEGQRNLDKFYEHWQNNRYKSIISYGTKNSEKYYLDKDKWYNLEDIKKDIPTFLMKNKNKYKVQKNSGGYEYFLNVNDTKHKNEVIPLIMIKDVIKKLVIRKRKSEIIDNYIEELYKKEIKKKNIKIYN